MTEGRKRIFERPLFVYLFTFFGLILLLTVLASFNRNGFVLIDTYFLYGGTITVLIGLFFINRGSRLSPSRYMRDDNYFHKVRVQENPSERIVWAIILAGVSVALIGFFWNHFLFR